MQINGLQPQHYYVNGSEMQLQSQFAVRSSRFAERVAHAGRKSNSNSFSTPKVWKFPARKKPKAKYKMQRRPGDACWLFLLQLTKVGENANAKLLRRVILL